MTVSPDSLATLDRDVRHALETCDPAGLDILGYGEISLIVALDDAGGRFACKRLPPFADAAAFERYAEVFADYLAALAAAGVEVVASNLIRVPAEQQVIAYCVQPALDPASLGPTVARGSGSEEFLTAVVDVVAGAVGPRLGFDSQISNWALVDGRPVYIDVTSPMLRDEAGVERTDFDIFVASLPWLLRAPVRRFLVDDILGTYYDPRTVFIDLAGNLLKERLDEAVPIVIAAANTHVDPPITVDEIESYYSRDARMWGLLQRLRRIDRGWQRHVRRRTYPFLLPEAIER